MYSILSPHKTGLEGVGSEGHIFRKGVTPAAACRGKAMLGGSLQGRRDGGAYIKNSSLIVCLSAWRNAGLFYCLKEGGGT